MSAEDRLFVPSDYFRRLRLEEVFGDAAEKPFEVDLGSGDGTFLVEMAARFPERNFLGVERLLGRVRKICRKAARRDLKNLKVLRLESAYTVEWLLPENSVSRLHLLFPDPWPKKKHHRRRLVNAEFLGGVAAALLPEGAFLFKTDDDDYFEAAREEVAGSGLFTGREWLDSGEFYSETDFERQWRAEGKAIHRHHWTKVVHYG